MSEIAKKYEWPALDSNPKVMTEYLHKIGMSEDWHFEEVYGMDSDMIECLQAMRQPIVGVIVAEKGGE